VNAQTDALQSRMKVLMAEFIKIDERGIDTHMDRNMIKKT